MKDQRPQARGVGNIYSDDRKGHLPLSVSAAPSSRQDTDSLRPFPNLSKPCCNSDQAIYWLNCATADALRDGDPQIVYLLPKVIEHFLAVERQAR